MAPSNFSNEIITETLFVFFECTIVNLATYRLGNLQMLLAIELFQKKKEEEEEEKKIKIALSLGFPNSYFYNKRCNMLLQWLY